MKLYKIKPYFDGVESESLYLTAWDEADVISQVEETGILLYDAYTIGYDIEEVEDIGRELVRQNYYALRKKINYE
jgi:hypothetical protein